MRSRLDRSGYGATPSSLVCLRSPVLDGLTTLNGHRDDRDEYQQRGPERSGETSGSDEAGSVGTIGSARGSGGTDGDVMLEFGEVRQWRELVGGWRDGHQSTVEHG